MSDWTYVGTADFGSDPGVSLGGHTFKEVLAIATVNDYSIYRTDSSTSTVVLNTPASFEFYWIPELGEVQLSQSFEHSYRYNHLLITMLFKPTYVRAFKVRLVSRNGGGTSNYNTASHGSIKVYCR